MSPHWWRSDTWSWYRWEDPPRPGTGCGWSDWSSAPWYEEKLWYHHFNDSLTRNKWTNAKDKLMIKIYVYNGFFIFCFFLSFFLSVFIFCVSSFRRSLIKMSISGCFFSSSFFLAFFFSSFLHVSLSLSSFLSKFPYLLIPFVLSCFSYLLISCFSSLSLSYFLYLSLPTYFSILL